jgi:RNA polymerase sigma factor (sigma-70 family)
MLAPAVGAGLKVDPMLTESLEQRLSRISTQWTLLGRAHGSNADEAGAAQRILFQRYGGAVHKYLLGALKDPDAAMDLFQDFAVRFLNGEFHRANPEKGRFRDYVKRALINLVHDYHRKRQTQELPLNPHMAVTAASESSEDEDALWLESWRSELLARAWAGLAQSDPIAHAVLQGRVRYPDESGADIALKLTADIGKTLTPGAFRVALHRAREKFADVLLDEVTNSLEEPSEQKLVAELSGLKLLAYCEPVLKKHVLGDE